MIFEMHHLFSMVCVSNDDEGGEVAINQEPVTMFIDISSDTIFIHIWPLGSFHPTALQSCDQDKAA